MWSTLTPASLENPMSCGQSSHSIELFGKPMLSLMIFLNVPLRSGFPVLGFLLFGFPPVMSFVSSASLD